ncbi:MAG: hypothetical protein LWY06_07035, partial [Firmicutes bacterium]|nr:hypothetical protein [Bacillota bacterium]
TGYDSKTQDVTVEADTTVTATTVTLTTTPTTGVTQWVSKRINLPEVNEAQDADVSNDGSKVTFASNGNVIVNWNNPSTTPYHIYVWTRATGTITRVSNNNLVPGSTAGANGASQYPAISGDGAYVVFRSVATDILANGLATTNNGDIFIVRISDLATARVSNSAANANNGGDAASNNPDINGDGTKVVFQSLATNIGNITHTAGYSHIYYVTVTDMVPGVRRMLDITLTSTQGIGLQGTVGAPTTESPESACPIISYDGRYTTFQSRACIDAATGLVGANIVASGGPTLQDAATVARESTTHIYRNDINADPATGWNILVSKHNGALAQAPGGTATNGEANGTPTCQLPVISEGGSRIAFQATSTNLGNTAAAANNIYLWNLNSAALTYVSIPLSGTVGTNTNAVIDRTGQYVGFLSTTVGLVSDVTNNLARFYVKDVNAGTNTYTLVSRGSSDQVPDVACSFPSMSGDGNYVVWDTAAKNLTNDSYTTGRIDVFVRKWK